MAGLADIFPLQQTPLIGSAFSEGVDKGRLQGALRRVGGLPALAGGPGDLYAAGAPEQGAQLYKLLHPEQFQNLGYAYGHNAVPVEMPDKTVHWLQPSADPKLPPKDLGIVNPKFQFLNTGDQFLPGNPQTGGVGYAVPPAQAAGGGAAPAQSGVQSSAAPAAGIPIQNRKKAYDTKRGSEEAEAQVAAENLLPEQINNFKNTERLVDEALAHPGMKYDVGTFVANPKNRALGYIPEWAGGQLQSATDFQRRIDQLLGQGFLNAYVGLKGGGQISNVEGDKATVAQLRLNNGVQTQSEKEVRAALEDMKNLMRGKLEITIARARGPGMPQQGNGSTDPLDMARDAISRGADRNAVIQRLRENNIDPSGL